MLFARSIPSVLGRVFLRRMESLLNGLLTRIRCWQLWSLGRAPPLFFSPNNVGENSGQGGKVEEEVGPEQLSGPLVKKSQKQSAKKEPKPSAGGDVK